MIFIDNFYKMLSTAGHIHPLAHMWHIAEGHPHRGRGAAAAEPTLSQDSPPRKGSSLPG